MDNWIRDLRAFVHDEEGYIYGTTEPAEYKVMTPEGNIEVKNDPRWGELLQVMSIFSGHRKNSSL